MMYHLQAIEIALLPGGTVFVSVRKNSWQDATITSNPYDCGTSRKPKCAIAVLNSHPKNRSTFKNAKNARTSSPCSPASSELRNRLTINQMMRHDSNERRRNTKFGIYRTVCCGQEHDKSGFGQ